MRRWIWLIVAGCSTPGAPIAVDAPEADVAVIIPDASSTTVCATASGEAGECMLTSACAAIANHISVANACPGPANIQCCVITPNVANNPPIPAGYKLMVQADVTQAMTSWAVAILHDPVTYPMFATAMMTFGALPVLARVEWHPPDFQNSVIHRGVTLYKPIP